MNTLSIILSVVSMGAMLIFIAPSIINLNRGHVLRNIALWLAVFAGLGVVYQNFGPESAHPLFSTPASRAGLATPQANRAQKPEQATDWNDKTSDKNEGFIPPRE